MRHGFFHGILYGAMRSFFMAMMATVGVLFGLLIIFSTIGSLSSSKGLELEREYTLELLPNAEGVRKIESKKSPAILQIDIEGVIGMEKMNAGAISRLLTESREGDLKNGRVKAILLRMNTPGGTVTDSDAIYRMIKAYKEKYEIPVYAYVDGICASGGMYIASAADKVYASDVSLIGSVGVLLPTFFNFSKLVEKFGVEAVTLTAGKDKDAMNPMRPWKPDEDAMYKELTEYYYDEFVKIVTEARPKLDKNKLIEEYGAKIFPSPIAEKYGYIDKAPASRNDVVKELLKELDIEDDYYQVVSLQKTNWAQQLFSSHNPLLRGEINHRLELPQELNSNLSGKYLYLYRAGE